MPKASEVAAGTQDYGIIATIDDTLRRVSLTSRTSTLVADLRKEGVLPRWPDLLPGGRHVLFTAAGSRGPDASNIEVLSLKDGARKPLVRAGFGRYLSDGYLLLHANQGTLFAVPFDRQRLAVQGTGVPGIGGARRVLRRSSGTRSLILPETGL